MPADDPTLTVTPSNLALAPGARWQPVVGPEIDRLVQRKLPQEARQHVIDTAASVLSRGIFPGMHDDQPTGLVVGYVQSGKTLSFTSVIALARDNGFQLVIVVAGTSKPLWNQSTQRLRKDLDIDSVVGSVRWQLYPNPVDSENNRRNITLTLSDWRDPDVALSDRATVLITVMKQHSHLRKLVALMRNLQMAGIPTLIIDDEADQASLNTLVKQHRQSTTYQQLLDLRRSVPLHTFLQYTATPQAPLLINIIDSLSPTFVEVLDPGTDYVGGREFFVENSDLTVVIPDNELPVDDHPLIEPPVSLLTALQAFMVGVAAGLVEGRSEANANRSMLIHPSQRTEPHREFREWVGNILAEWARIFSLPETDSDHQDLMGDFRSAYDDLHTTATHLPAFDDLRRRLPRAFRLTVIEEVNARVGQTPFIEWGRSYGWILIGGQSMDRGFTVEGLTVTYMPRGTGVGNADTVQQRGRFFGYKRRYLGLCRIFLEQGALSAFQAYVEHEEFMRGQLQGIQQSGRPLSTWKRAFVLSPDLRPCRQNVVDHEYARGNYSDQWFKPVAVEVPLEVLQANRRTVGDFLNALAFAPLDESQHDGAQNHQVCRGVPLQQVVENLIVPFRVTGASDSANLVGVLLQLSRALEDNPHETATVIWMSEGFPRRREIDSDGRINELFQGPTRAQSGGYTYPGDGAIRDTDQLTIQVHQLNLFRGDAEVCTNVRTIAVWCPRRLAVSWVSQHQPNV